MPTNKARARHRTGKLCHERWPAYDSREGTAALSGNRSWPGHARGPKPPVSRSTAMRDGPWSFSDRARALFAHSQHCFERSASRWRTSARTLSSLCPTGVGVCAPLGPAASPCWFAAGDALAAHVDGNTLGSPAPAGEVKYVDEFAKLSDLELVQLLEREARLLLEDQSGGGDNDGNGDPGALSGHSAPLVGSHRTCLGNIWVNRGRDCY